MSNIVARICNMPSPSIGASTCIAIIASASSPAPYCVPRYFIAARLFDLAQVELRELEKRVPPPSRAQTHDLHLYLTRLYFASHRYTRGITLISEAAEQDPTYWHEQPEQLLIYFPQPYLPLFGKEAFRVNLPPELLLAVTRQESAFRPQARSRSDARGLMQIIPPTARDIVTAPQVACGRHRAAAVRASYQYQAWCTAVAPLDRSLW